MDFDAERVLVECTEVTTSTCLEGIEHCEHVALELQLLGAPHLVHEVSLQTRHVEVLQHAEVVSVDTSRCAAPTVDAHHFSLQQHRAARNPVRSLRSNTWARSFSASSSGTPPVTRAVGHLAKPGSASGVNTGSGAGEHLTPLCLVGKDTGTAREQALTLTSDGLNVLTVRAYGVCGERLRILLRFQLAPAAGGVDRAESGEGTLPSWFQDAAVDVALADGGAVGGPATFRGMVGKPLFTALLRRTMERIRVGAISLAQSPVTAAHLVPLLNASQKLRAAGPQYKQDAVEADILAGLALMRCRKFVQCKEVWQRCACSLLEAAGVVIAKPAKGSLRGGNSGLPRLGILQSEVQAPLCSGLSIRPFANCISATFDVSLHKTIFLQIMIAACAIELSGGLLQEQHLDTVLTALHLVAKLHLVDLQATPSVQLHPLPTPHDAQTVLLSLQPHVTHVLCAVVAETLQTEAATQWCHVAAAALRCLDFVVHTCISCAFEPHVIDTIVRCFNCCDGEGVSELAAVGARNAASEPYAGHEESGKEELRTALHHFVETCHDVLPSLSMPLLLQAGGRLVEHILGSQGQRNWASLHVHLLRLLMRIVVLCSGDAAGVFLVRSGTYEAERAAGAGTLPFLDYLLRLLSAPRSAVEDRGRGRASTPVEAACGQGMHYVGQRCWDILRTHLLLAVPRHAQQLLIRWLASSLSDSRSSHLHSQMLLLSMIGDLAHAASGSQQPLSEPAGGSATQKEEDVSTPSKAATFRVHPVALTACGADLQPLLQPLHEWLLLLASRLNAIGSTDEPLVFSDCMEALPAESAALPHCHPRASTSVFRGRRRCLSQGLLPASCAEASLENEHRVDFLRVKTPETAKKAEHFAADRFNLATPEDSLHFLTAGQKYESSQVQQLLLVWRVLVDVVAQLSAETKPDLHTLARPLLDEVRQVCVQGNPSEQVLQVTRRVLQDLPPCDGNSALFLKSFLLAFCDRIPHSVFDETFAVLEQVFRLLQGVGVDSAVMESLLRSMLNQCTSRSPAYRRSQEALVSLLMSNRKVMPRSASPKSAAGDNNEGTSFTESPSRHDPGSPGHDASAMVATMTDDDFAEDDLAGEQSDGHFELVVQFCLGCDFSGSMPSSVSDAGCAPAGTGLVTDPDNVERLQFACSIFKAMRFAHLAVLLANLSLFGSAVRQYVQHPLEKVRLLALDLLKSACEASFNTFAHRVLKLSVAGDAADTACRWWALLADAVGTISAACGEASRAGAEASCSFVSTPAVVLASCRLLLKVGRSRVLGLCHAPGGLGGSFGAHEAASATLSAPTPAQVQELLQRVIELLSRLSHGPWQRPRLAALGAAVAWAPLCLLVEDAGAVRALAGDLLRSPDCVSRCAGLCIVSVLARRAEEVPRDLCDAVAALRSDWNARVRAAADEVAAHLPRAQAPSGPPGMHPEFPNPHWVAAALSEPAWDSDSESVYVDEIFAVQAGAVEKRCVTDRFEDFLDACDGIGVADSQHELSLSLRRSAGRSLGAAGGRREVEHELRVTADPELYGAPGDQLGQGGTRLGDFLRSDAEADDHDDVGEDQLSQGGTRLGDLLRSDAEDDGHDEVGEDDLGIIDAGDEEWMEVLDVIREHSAVTIFNNTDSTWYISSKHPTFVRPLHGKHRHSMQQYRQRSPSPSDLSTWSGRRRARSDTQIASHQPRAPGAGTRSHHQGVEVGSCVPADRAGPGGAAVGATLQRQLRRRPHSAPNPVHGRTSTTQDRRLSRPLSGQQRAGVGNSTGLTGSNTSTPMPTRPERARTGSAGQGHGHSMQHAWSGSTGGSGGGRLAPADPSVDGPARSMRQPSPVASPISEDDILFEEDSASSSSEAPVRDPAAPRPALPCSAPAAATGREGRSGGAVIFVPGGGGDGGDGTDECMVPAAPALAEKPGDEGSPAETAAHGSGREPPHSGCATVGSSPATAVTDAATPESTSSAKGDCHMECPLDDAAAAE